MYLVTIQRVLRGIRGRYKAQLAREARQEFLSHSPFALLIQQNVRAYISRLHHTNISKSIREMYIIRKQGTMIALMIEIEIEMIVIDMLVMIVIKMIIVEMIVIALMIEMTCVMLIIMLILMNINHHSITL